MKYVLFADDQVSVVSGFGLAVAQMEGVLVQGYAKDGEQALEMCEKSKPDVLVARLRLPKLDGVSLMNALESRELATRVVIYTGTMNGAILRTAQQVLPAALFHKQDTLEQLRTAVDAACSGGVFVSPTAAKVLKSSGDVAMPLTPMELTVAKRLCAGEQNKQISTLLHISEKTVSSHRQHIYSRLGVHDIVGLMNWMSQQKWNFDSMGETPPSEHLITRN